MAGYLQRVFRKRLKKEKEPREASACATLTPQPIADSSTISIASSEMTPSKGYKDIKAETTDVAQTDATDSQHSNTDSVTNIQSGELTQISLWDTAYDSLKEDTDRRELLEAYESLLSRILVRDAAASSPGASRREDTVHVENQIPRHDPAARREMFTRIAESGLKHMEDRNAKVTIFGGKVSLQDTVGQIGKAVDWIQSYIKDAVKDVPYASAVMAGISLVLPLLKNPTIVDDANRQGFTYVTSQMCYYVEMEPLLFRNMGPGLKMELTIRVIDLYKLIIEFQVRSVIRFYRSAAKNYFRSVVNYDSWDDQLDHIKVEETKLEKMFEKAFTGTNTQQLSKLAREAETSRKVLNDLCDGIQKFLGRDEQRFSNAEYRRRRDRLQATDPTLDKERIEQEKGGLLKESYCWVLEHLVFRNWQDSESGRYLWIRGDPGKGKTMLVCGIIDELLILKTKAPNTNISFFFCQATNSDINSATAVLRGLIYSLVLQQYSLADHINDDPLEGRVAWQALCRVLTRILEDPCLNATYLIIDALDECTEDLPELLNPLTRMSSEYSHIKWIVSSRNWPSIEKELNNRIQLEIRLELNENNLATAIDSFIQYKVTRLSKLNKYTPRVRDAVHQHLKSNASGTFLWVALVCRRLAKVASRNVQKKLEGFPPGLGELYKQMWSQIGDSDDADLCRSFLYVAITVFRPITLDELPSCVNLPEDVEGDDNALMEIVNGCGSFLTLRGRKISLVHQSAKDFLLREADPDEVGKIHHSIFYKSLKILSRILKRDIYGLSSPGYSVTQVKQPEPDPLATVRYACVHWIDHLTEYSSCQNENAKEGFRGNDLISGFLLEDFLHWVEALSLLRSLAKGIASMIALECFLKTTMPNKNMIERVQDASRFMLYHKVGIEGQPLQVYASGLVFSPAHSITRNQYEAKETKWMNQKPTVENNWDTCLQTLEGHSGPVTSVTFSHDSKLLASASYDHTIKIWDSNSGQCLQTLEGHSGSVTSVTFSHDSKMLASASFDRTVRMWDISSGQCLQTLEDHSDSILVAFSYDSKLIAWASTDETIKVRDANSGQCFQTLQGHDHWVLSVTFSCDSKLLASASDKTIKVWDANSGRCLQTLQGHDHWVLSVTFSCDSKLLASASADNTIKVWDTRSGKCLQTLQGHSSATYSVVFSYDSKRLASASSDHTVKVWDVGGECLQTLKGHSEKVRSVTFSHDSNLIASASGDETIKVWDANSGQCLQTLGAKAVTSVKSFDITNSQLETNRGTISLPFLPEGGSTNVELQLARFKGYNLSSDDTWICWNSEKLLWLPPEYRSNVLDVSGSRIGLGCNLGRVLILGFDSSKPFNPTVGL